MVRIRRQWMLSIWVALCLLCCPIPGQAKAPKPTIREQLEALQDLLHKVDRQYYEETDIVELMHGAIEGYLAGLDPHSTYIRPDELKDTQERLRGSFEGIGIFFEIVDDVLTVLSPIEGSPAYRAGLLPGDQIRKIDGESAIGPKVQEVTDRLKGKKGTRVAVSVRREGEPELLEFEIVRDKIQVPSVPYAFQITPEIGYVKITRFSSRTAEDLRGYLLDLQQQGARKLILDLRGNGGGYLEQAVAVANQFIERGRLLVYTEGRHPNSREDHRAGEDPIIPVDVPVVVMVNGASASASEIVAGAIQDYDRGLVVGHTTFGKGLVQKQYRLKNGGAVLLTIARYFTPSDRPIQRPFTKDRNAYMAAAFDGYDPNLDPDSLSNKPVYYTRILRRKVFGEGGISPDVVLQRDSLTTLERQLLREKHFLVFAKQEEPGIARSYPDFQAFFDRYKVGRRELSRFKSLLKDRNVVFTEAAFKARSEFIKKQIKQFIAQIRWGAKAEGMVRVHQDSEVHQAIALFNRAEDLLADRSVHYNRGRTHIPDASPPLHKQVR